MSVQRLGVGEHGEVKYRTLADGWVTASVYYRSGQGRLRRIEATGDSRSAARRVALKSFERTAAAGGGAEYGRRTTFRDVAADWLVSVEELAVAGRRSPRTAALYRHALERHVLPGRGELRLEELTTARIDWFVRERRRTHGYAVAKLCRSVTSGVCGFAVRRDAMRFNPVRDVGALEVVSERQPRAMTSDEVSAWLAILDRSEFAREHDLPDFVRFLLGTGCRLGEALALTWDGVDLERGLVSVSATLIRVRGQGMLSKRPKTRAGVRVLRVPTWLVELLRKRRAADPESAGAVFPDSIGGHRDPNNVGRAHRVARTGTGFEWVVPHTYRKTVATVLDGQGLSARTIADQLGHARISMTQDIYMGRRTVDESAAVALELVAGLGGPTPPLHNR